MPLPRFIAPPQVWEGGLGEIKNAATFRPSRAEGPLPLPLRGCVRGPTGWGVGDLFPKPPAPLSIPGHHLNVDFSIIYIARHVAMHSYRCYGPITQ